MNALRKYIYISFVTLLITNSLYTMEQERLSILTAISPTCQSEIFENPAATISFLEAFMSGEFQFIGPTPIFLLYDTDGKPKRGCSLETASEALITFQGYLSLLKNTGRKLPFLEELRAIKNANSTVEEFKKAYSTRISELSNNDLIQIELKRLSNFIKNRDLAVQLKDSDRLKDEIEAIKENRQQLKQGFLDRDSKKILNACITKLHTGKFVTLFDGLRNNVHTVGKMTEENFKSNDLIS